MATLSTRLASHDSVFRHYLSEIPAKHYFPTEFDDETTGPWIGKATHAKERERRKRRHKERMELHLLKKFDPSAYASVPDLQMETGQDAVTGKECAKEKSERRKDDAGSEDENEESGEDEESEEESGDENDQDSDEDNVMDNIEMKDGEESDSSDSEEGDDKKKKKKKAVSQETRVSAEDAIGSTPRKSREELRQLVQERIENMRKERKADAKTPQQLRKERQKKKDEKKAKKKEKRDQQKAQKKGNVKKPDSTANAEPAAKKRKTEGASTGNVEFSAISTSTSKSVPTYLEKKNKRPSAQSLLKQLEEEKKRLSQLENSDMQSRVRQEKAWQSSLAKAQGEKVKDNPALLRKSIRKEKQRKVKSAKKWADRKQTEKDQIAERQRKREENIKKKIDEKKERKMGGKKRKRPDTPQKRAGFEGKKRKFLNK